MFVEKNTYMAEVEKPIAKTTCCDFFLTHFTRYHICFLVHLGEQHLNDFNFRLTRDDDGASIAKTFAFILRRLTSVNYSYRGHCLHNPYQSSQTKIEQIFPTHRAKSDIERQRVLSIFTLAFVPICRGWADSGFV